MNVIRIYGIIIMILEIICCIYQTIESDNLYTRIEKFVGIVICTPMLIYFWLS